MSIANWETEFLVLASASEHGQTRVSGQSQQGTVCGGGGFFLSPQSLDAGRLIGAGMGYSQADEA